MYWKLRYAVITNPHSISGSSTKNDVDCGKQFSILAGTTTEVMLLPLLLQAPQIAEFVQVPLIGPLISPPVSQLEALPDV